MSKLVAGFAFPKVTHCKWEEGLCFGVLRCLPWKEGGRTMV